MRRRWDTTGTAVMSRSWNLIRPGEDFSRGSASVGKQPLFAPVDCGVRVVLARTAAVLSSEGGALGRIALPYRMFLGGPLGSGNQWFPWIHIDDVVASMVVALRSENIDGPVNVVSPGAVRMNAFARALGESLGRPSFMRVPQALLTVALGEMAEMILVSQRVIPGILLLREFRFRYSTLETALREIFHS